MRTLEALANNEIRWRGQTNGWKTLQAIYKYDDLTEQEAKILAHLVQQARVFLPEVPLALMYDE